MNKYQTLQSHFIHNKNTHVYTIYAHGNMFLFSLMDNRPRNGFMDYYDERVCFTRHIIQTSFCCVFLCFYHFRSLNSDLWCSVFWNLLESRRQLVHLRLQLLEPGWLSFNNWSPWSWLVVSLINWSWWYLLIGWLTVQLISLTLIVCSCSPLWGCWWSSMYPTPQCSGWTGYDESYHLSRIFF